MTKPKGMKWREFVLKRDGLAERMVERRRLRKAARRMHAPYRYSESRMWLEIGLGYAFTRRMIEENLYKRQWKPSV